jgi:tetratricopeptide (TPR) repeat protein
MVSMPTADKGNQGRYGAAMSEISNREALDGVLHTVATLVGDACPRWIDAYAHLLTEEILDRHHIGLLIGVARGGDLTISAAWMSALNASDVDEPQRQTLRHIWALAQREALGDDHVAPGHPFMRRLHCELRVYAYEERGALVDAMTLRSDLFEGWSTPAHAEQAFCGLDLVDDLMSLDRIDEATELLGRLEPMVEALSSPVLEAELFDRWADVARERQEHKRAGQCYRLALNALEEIESPHLRLSRTAAAVNELVQRGQLQSARTLLEQPTDCGDHPFAARVLQRRLTSLCQLYTTLDDKRSLYEILKELIESVIDVRWALFGTLSSHLDDLVNLACQFGHGTQAHEFLDRGRALVIRDHSEAWLDIAAIRIASWKGQEAEIVALLEDAADSPLMLQDLFYCQTVTTLINEYGAPEQRERSTQTLERCTASLIERRLFPRAANSLQFKAQGLAQQGQLEDARRAFRESVTVLREPGHNREQVIEAAMDWATWEIRHGHLDRLEEPIELVISHSDDDAAPSLMARLSFQQAMYFAMNPNAHESEEDPKAVVGRWIALAADQYLEGNCLAEANGVYMHLADWLDGQGEHQAATEILELVAQGAMSTGDTQLIWHAALVAANRLEQEDDGEAAVQLLTETLESCESDDSATRGAQHFELANLLNVTNQHVAALAHYQTAHEGLLDGSVRDRARVLLGLGASQWHAHEDELAVTHWLESFELAQRTADRDFICDIALRIDTQLLERQDRVTETRITLLETLILLGDRCRWELIANGSDLPLRLAEEYARTDRDPTHITETVHTLRNLADAVTNVGLTHDGTLLLQRASGIEMLRGNHEAGLSLMREVLERIEASVGTVLRTRECLLQAALLAAGGLVHEAWDRVSEVREWLATIDDDGADEDALDELTLTCQLQCATLHLLGDKPDLVVGPLSELITTCESSETVWPATQSARVTLAAALINLGHAAKASEQLMAIEAHLDEDTNGWFDSVIMAGRLGQRALGEALIKGVQETLGPDAAARWSSTEIAMRCSSDWLAFTSGEAIDATQTETMAQRALQARDFNLATVLTLLTACYASDAGDTAAAHRAVSDAIELSRRHWAMDEFGLMWGVLLPAELKRFAANLLEADRLQHLN